MKLTIVIAFWTFSLPFLIIEWVKLKVDKRLSM
jgi:hypothetical protein